MEIWFPADKTMADRNR